MASRRRSKNKLIHRTTIKCRITGKDIRHLLYFRRGDIYKTLKVPVVSSLDLECSSRPIKKNYNLSCHSTVPKDAAFSQDILAYSFAHKSLYQKHELPDNLSDARVLIYDDKTHTQLEFFHKLFTQIRSDVNLLHDFFMESLSKDEGTPSLSQLTQIERTQYFLATRCSICKTKFNTVKYNPTTQKYYRIRKVIDHCHLSETTHRIRFNPQNPMSQNHRLNTTTEFQSRIRYITCNGCNLHLSLPTVNPKMMHTFWVHNGK